MLPEGLEERYRALRRRPKLRAELKAEREAAVASTERGDRYELWAPSDPLDVEEHVRPPRLGPDGAMIAGLDAQGRPVLLRPHTGREGPLRVAWPDEDDDETLLSVRLLTWEGRRVEIVGFLTSDNVSHVTWVDLDEGGRPLRLSMAGVPFNALGKGAAVVDCTWEGDRCVRTREAVVYESDRLYEHVREAEYDGEGLLRVRTPERVVWERELDGWEEDPLPHVAAVRAYVAATGRAVAAVLAESPVTDPFCLHVSVSSRQIALEVGGAAYREAARRRAGSPLDVLRGIGGTVWLDRRLDADGRRALRSLRQLGHDEPEQRTTWWEACVELVRDLDRPWPGRAEPFLPYVGGDDLPYRGDDEPGPLVLAREALGDERVDAFLAALAPTGKRPRVRRRPRSRDELRRLLRELDLPERVAGEALWGLALLGGGKGESRLGGRPSLPQGEAWPTCEERPLTHLATIDLAELPEVDGRDRVPADGTLVLLADLTEEAALWEPAPIGGDARVVLRHIPAGTALHRPEPPPHDRDDFHPPVELRRRSIRFEPVLTLPETLEGLTDDERLGYETLYWRLVEITPGLREPAHLLLGHPAPTQEDPCDPGEIALLHIGPDGALGFDFLDAGDLTVHGTAADIAAGRWDRLTISPSSC